MSTSVSLQYACVRVCLLRLDEANPHPDWTTALLCVVLKVRRISVFASKILRHASCSSSAPYFDVELCTESSRSSNPMAIHTCYTKLHPMMSLIPISRTAAQLTTHVQWTMDQWPRGPVALLPSLKKFVCSHGSSWMQTEEVGKALSSSDRQTNHYKVCLGMHTRPRVDKQSFENDGSPHPDSWEAQTKKSFENAVSPRARNSNN